MASLFGGFACSRNFLIFLNVFYIIVAFILIAMAAYAKAIAFIVDYSIVGGIIACGVFLILVSIVGIIGAVLHHQVMLFVYMIVLGVLFIVQFSVACACLALNSLQQQNLFILAWDKSSWNVKVQMQGIYNCCGVVKENQSDILHNDADFGIGHPPCNISVLSCRSCNDTCCTGVESTDSETCCLNSCWDAVKSDVARAVLGVGAVSLIFSFTELIGIWLAYRYRNLKNPNFNPNAFL